MDDPDIKEMVIWTNIAESLQKLVDQPASVDSAKSLQRISKSLQGVHAELIRIGEVLQDTAKGSANESVDKAREQYHRNR